jgi:hypothetical protein
VQTVSFNLRVFSSISGEPFRNYSTFVDFRGPKVFCQTHMCIKVVKREVFGSIFIAGNDYIKLCDFNDLLDAFAVCLGCV